MGSRKRQPFHSSPPPPAAQGQCHLTEVSLSPTAELHGPHLGCDELFGRYPSSPVGYGGKVLHDIPGKGVSEELQELQQSKNSLFSPQELTLM